MSMAGTLSGLLRRAELTTWLQLRVPDGPAINTMCDCVIVCVCVCACVRMRVRM